MKPNYFKYGWTEAHGPKRYHNAAKLKHEYTLVEVKSYVIKAYSKSI